MIGCPSLADNDGDDGKKSKAEPSNEFKEPLLLVSEK